VPGSPIADAGFLAALLDRRDRHHRWAVAQAGRFPPPWHTCEAALTEAFYLLDPTITLLVALLERRQAVVTFNLDPDIEPVLTLMRKYADVPMSLADACLVRMSEILPDPVVLTTDSDFRVYRRHGRLVVPAILPD
jgi:predicted nucleic acid-binding protein